MIRRVGRGWEAFWFTPQETSTLALVRIAFGLLVTGWTLALTPDLLAFYGPDGILPQHPSGNRAAWGVLEVSTAPAVVIGLYLALLAGGVALTVGWHTRLAALIVLVGVMSFERRNPFVLNSGDGLVRNLALFVALAPAGVAVSLDRWRRAPGRFWEFPARAPVALRLAQIQLSVIYISGVWAKVRGDTWNEGTAVSYALRIEDIHRFPVPGFVTDSVVVSELLTYGTLGMELAIGILVWNRAARPYVLGLGVLLHLGIDYSIMVGFFSYAMFVLYMAFIPPETASRLILRVRAPIARVRLRRVAPSG